MKLSVLAIAATLVANAALASPLAPLTSPRPHPRPAELAQSALAPTTSPRPHARPGFLVAATVPCTVYLEALDGFGWYTDGTVAGRRNLPETSLKNIEEAAALADTLQSTKSGRGVHIIPLCF